MASHSGSGGGATADSGTPPLPSGAATAAKQDQEIALLTSIDAKLTLLLQTIPYVSGSLASPNVITAAGGISIGDYWSELQFVKSNGGAVTITANPRVQASTKVGATLKLYGTSNTDSLILNDGNGLLLNGPCTLINGSIITLVYIGSSTWTEVSRNGI